MAPDTHRNMSGSFVTTHATLEIGSGFTGVFAAFAGNRPPCPLMVGWIDVHFAVAGVAVIKTFVANRAGDIREMGVLSMAGHVVARMRGDHRITVVAILAIGRLTAYTVVTLIAA